MIVDTNVLIWYFRGDKNAKKVLNQVLPFSISSVTYIELVQGMRNKDELNKLRELIKVWRISILQITEKISNRSMYYSEEYFLSHSILLADALIAATMFIHSETLLTGNAKDYSYINGLKIREFTPLREN